MVSPIPVFALPESCHTGDRIPPAGHKAQDVLTSQVGRGLRLSPDTGKEYCHIIDVVDSVNRANGMLVSPTLFGLSHDDLELKDEQGEENEQSSEGATSELGNADPDEEERTLSRVKRVTYIDEDDPFGVGDARRMPVVKLSMNAWVSSTKLYQRRYRYFADML
jgi:ATP-dependent helicase IRC3